MRSTCHALALTLIVCSVLVVLPATEAEASPSYLRARNAARQRLYGFGRNYRRSSLPLYQRERLDKRRQTVLRDRSLVRQIKRRPRTQKDRFRRIRRLHGRTLTSANVGHGRTATAAPTHGTHPKQMRRIGRTRLKPRSGRLSTPVAPRTPAAKPKSGAGKSWRRWSPNTSKRRAPRGKSKTRRGGWKVWKR